VGGESAVIVPNSASRSSITLASFQGGSEVSGGSDPDVGAESVALKRIDDQRWHVYFCEQPIGVLDEHLKRVLAM
jgi:hypothetical protein